MSSKKILIVGNEQVISQMLSVRGYSPVQAATVESALKIFPFCQPELVLVSTNLPNGSGLDVLREIKRQKPKAVVVIMTAHALAEIQLFIFGRKILTSLRNQPVDMKTNSTRQSANLLNGSNK